MVGLTSRLMLALVSYCFSSFPLILDLTRNQLSTMIIPAGVEKSAEVVARYTTVDTKAVILCETWEDTIEVTGQNAAGYVVDLSGGYGTYVCCGNKLIAICGDEAIVAMKERDRRAELAIAKRDADRAAATAAIMPVDIHELTPKPQAFKDELAAKAEERVEK